MVIGVQLFLTHTFFGRAVLAVAQDQLALRLMGVNPVRVKEFAFALSIATAGVAGAFLIVIQPVQPAIGREYIGLVFAVCVLGGMGSIWGTLLGAFVLGLAESFHVHILRGRRGRPPSRSDCFSSRWRSSLPGCSGDEQPGLRHSRVRNSAGNRGALSAHPQRVFLLGCVHGAAIRHPRHRLEHPRRLRRLRELRLGGLLRDRRLHNGCALLRLQAAPRHHDTGWDPGAGLAGLGLGYLTLRLRGVFFAIASLALAVVLFTLVVNWDYVGGARGAYVLQPTEVPFGLPRYIHVLFSIEVLMAATALVIARAIETSTLGRGLAAIRDDELAAESAGVPTLRLKIFSAAVSGALMGMAGTTFPYYLSYIEPSSVFSLSYAVNSIAMPLIGGMMTWPGPLDRRRAAWAPLQQLVQVTISSAWNLLDRRRAARAVRDRRAERDHGLGGRVAAAAEGVSEGSGHE